MVSHLPLMYCFEMMANDALRLNRILPSDWCSANKLSVNIENNTEYEIDHAYLLGKVSKVLRNSCLELSKIIRHTLITIRVS